MKVRLGALSAMQIYRFPFPYIRIVTIVQAYIFAEWHAARNDEVEPLWQLDWDDEAVGNDFLGRLKGELAKGKMKE